MTTSSALSSNIQPTTELRFGRIPIVNVSPVIECGRFAAKAVPGEDLVIGATVFREGHDLVGVTAVLYDPAGQEVQRHRMHPVGQGLDRWNGLLRPETPGDHTFTVEGWADLYGTWHHNAVVKIAAGVDVELMLAEGAAMFTAAAAGRSAADAEIGRAHV